MNSGPLERQYIEIISFCGDFLNLVQAHSSIIFHRKIQLEREQFPKEPLGNRRTNVSSPFAST